MDRRGFLSQTGAAAALAGGADLSGAFPTFAQDGAATAFIDETQHATFRYFAETTSRTNGLAPDRHPTAFASSIGAIGFALTAFPIGVERGWMSRAEARARVRTSLKFLNDAPQGHAAAGMAGYKGFFYHFLEMDTGARYRHVELSTIDTALLMMGVLFCQSWFDGPQAEEADIRQLAEALYTRVDWRWAQPPSAEPAICHGWRPEDGFLPYAWRGYNEAMLLYILALGSPSHPVPPAAYGAWLSGYEQSWGLNGGPLPHVGFGPMFGHQYTQVWIDLRGLQDQYMRARGLDYFENSRRATLAQHAWAQANPGRWKGYGPNVWGLTACDGPGDLKHVYAGEQRRFRGYSARSPGPNDDGTIAPTAALGSIAFAPELVVPAALEMNRRWGEQIFGPHGFVDAFNPSFDFDDLAPKAGRRVPGVGWIGPDRLGIDQGPIVAMIENWRSGMVWRVMRGNPHIRRGLQRAGFTGGWLERP